MFFNKFVKKEDDTVESGGSRIRTYGRVTASGFQDQRIRPLCHAPMAAILSDETASERRPGSLLRDSEGG